MDLKKRIVLALLNVLAKEDRYGGMFRKNSDAFKKKAPEVIEWAKRVLKKNDRIVWFLKKYRLLDQEYQDLEPDQWEKEEDYFKDVTGNPAKHLMDTLEHFITNAEVNQFSKILEAGFPAGATVAELFAQLKAIEESETAKKKKKDDEQYVEEADVFLEIDDEWSWQLMDKGYCEREGKAMRHCGNANADEGDQILSLRQMVKDGEEEKYKPKLTFIYNDGSLGEMKGFANEKPGKDMHKYIVELLKVDDIKEIKGGGHLPGNNFHWEDLTNDEQTTVMSANPNLEIVNPVDTYDLAQTAHQYLEDEMDPNQFMDMDDFDFDISYATFDERYHPLLKALEESDEDLDDFLNQCDCHGFEVGDYPRNSVGYATENKKFTYRPDDDEFKNLTQSQEEDFEEDFAEMFDYDVKVSFEGSYIEVTYNSDVHVTIHDMDTFEHRIETVVEGARLQAAAEQLGEALADFVGSVDWYDDEDGLIVKLAINEPDEEVADKVERIFKKFESKSYVDEADWRDDVFVISIKESADTDEVVKMMPGDLHTLHNELAATGQQILRLTDSGEYEED